MANSPIETIPDETPIESNHEKRTEDDNAVDETQKADVLPYPQDAFGNEELAEVRYKTLKWWYDIYSIQGQKKYTDQTLVSGNVLSSWLQKPSHWEFSPYPPPLQASASPQPL